MSEETKTEIKTEVKDEPKTTLSVVDDNVALMQSKIVMLEKAVTEKDELIAELTTKLGQATEFIEGDQKKMLLAEIAPKVDILDEILMLKSIDELKAMKKTLDVAVIPAFKSGTQVTYAKKTDPRHAIDTMFEKAQKKRLEANK